MTARSDERGSVTLVVGVGAFTLLLLALGVADLGAMLHARARAQAAADAAALAAAVRLAPVLGQGDDPTAAAREVAAANGATLVSCDCPPGGTDAIVEVRLPGRAVLVVAWRDRAVRARARAVLDPDVLSYRSPD